MTPERRRTLEAVVARILPGVESPGATDTAAAAAIEGAIAHRCMGGLRGPFEELLDRLETDAAQQYGGELSACAPDERDALLQRLEEDPSPWTRFLFRYLVTFTLEGLLGDPSHGGNRDFRGWDAIGLRADDVRSGLCRGGQDG